MPRPGEAILLNWFDFLRPGIPGVRASTIRSLAGWWETPDSRSQDSAMVATDGDAAGRRNYEARMVTIEGDVSCDTRAALFAFRDRVAGLVGANPVRFEVNGHGPDQWAMVVRSGGLQWSEKSPVAASWSLTVKAPDPCKYGVTRRFPESGTSPAGSSVEVFHEGNYGAAPRITVQGYSPGGFTAFGTGSDRFRVTEGVNTGETLVADFKVGHVFLNGVRKPAAGGYRSLARIRPYELRATNVIPAQPDLASNVRFFVEVTDTWI